MNPLKLFKKYSLVRNIGEEASKKPFYSSVDKAIEEIVKKQPKATGDQYLGMMLKSKGVKPAEVKDRGLESALKGKGKMTGQDLVKVAEENPPPQITGKTLHEYEYWDEGDKPIDMARYSGGKYRDYRTPGGENYREILIKLPQPERGAVKPVTAQDLKDKGYRIGDFEYNPYTNQASYTLYDKDGNWVSQRSGGYGVSNEDQALISEAQGMTIRAQDEASKPLYKASHFDKEGENLLAHARVQDMRGPNNEKILLIDEIQSDWHQAARDARKREISGLMELENISKEEASRRVPDVFGYSQPETQRIKGVVQPDEYGSYKVVWEDGTFSGGYSKESAEAIALEGKSNAITGVVSDAPFKKNWHELVMKRLVDDAAKNGYDRVVITPGAMQARRYDLSEKVDYIDYIKKEDGTYRLGVVTKDGEGVRLPKDSFTAEELPDVLGREVADKIIAGEGQSGGGRKTLRGVDLEVGGEGMKGFYDQMLPSYIKKQYGVEVGQHPVRVNNYQVVGDNYGKGFAVTTEQGTTISKYPTIEEAQAAALKMNEVPYHSFDITPEMRQSIIEKGQPLYQMAPVGVGAAGAASMGEEEPETYKEGGEVKDSKKQIEEDKESNLSRFRFYGGGGQDKYAFDAGGRLFYDIPVGKNSVISPYIQGYVVKPSGEGLTGKLTGAGVQYRKSFKKGGKIKKPISMDAMRLAVMKRK